jgi:hypothetical protein
MPALQSPVVFKASTSDMTARSLNGIPHSWKSACLFDCLTWGDDEVMMMREREREGEFY